MPFLGGGFGSAEMMIFGIIALLLFGKNLPEVARSVGSSFMEFKKGMQEVKDEVTNPSTPSSYTPDNTDSASSRPTVNDDNDDFTAPRFEIPSDA